MRRDAVYENYAAARKNLISEVHQSIGDDFHGSKEEANESEAPVFESAKLRIFMSMLLFIGFLYCWYTDTKIFGYSAENVIEMMADDRYYSIIKDYTDWE